MSDLNIIDKPQLKVAIQGVAGCFHDDAARRFFNNHHVETIECETFANVFEMMSKDASMLGIVAIENTIAGSLLQNHELLRMGHAVIIGEQKLRISHVLAALPGESIDKITEVNSHPIAIRQCEQFLSRHPYMRKVEWFDTAGSARDIKQDNMLGHAAICSEYAAKLYGLDILEKGIETNKRNFTRFLILADPLIAAELKPSEHSIDKSSIEFTLPHTNGALSKVLTILSFYDINLSKIQSMPIIGREWEYRFFADLTFESYIRYHQAIDAIRPLTNELRVLGEYIDCKESF